MFFHLLDSIFSQNVIGVLMVTTVTKPANRVVLRVTKLVMPLLGCVPLYSRYTGLFYV